MASTLSFGFGLLLAFVLNAGVTYLGAWLLCRGLRAQIDEERVPLATTVLGGAITLVMLVLLVMFFNLGLLASVALGLFGGILIGGFSPKKDAPGR